MMPTNQISVERWSVVSRKSFADVIAAIDAVTGHPDMRDFVRNVGAATNWQELEAVIHPFLGPSGFMEFTRFNPGQILSKAQGASAPKIVRIVIGNPLIMKKMIEHVHDAASYAPVTILIDERPDGVHLSYNRMASYLASYGNLAALEVARNLDAKVEALLTAAAN
jgi:uncharacterized protein (DUF302 family)